MAHVECKDPSRRICFQRKIYEEELESLVLPCKLVNNEPCKKYTEIYKNASMIASYMKKLYERGYDTQELKLPFNIDVIGPLVAPYERFRMNGRSTKRPPPFFSPFELQWLAVAISERSNNRVMGILGSLFGHSIGNISTTSGNIMEDLYTFLEGGFGKRNTNQRANVALKDKNGNYLRVDGQFMTLLKKVTVSSRCSTCHLVKVNEPGHCYHVLLPLILHMNHGRLPSFYQILWCTQNTSFDNFLSAITNRESLINQFYVIMHPEFLPDSQKSLLRDHLRKQTGVMTRGWGPFILVISSCDFDIDQHGGYVTQFDGNMVQVAREASRMWSSDDRRVKFKRPACVTWKDSPVTYVWEPAPGNAQYIDKQEWHLPNPMTGSVRLVLDKGVFEDGVEFWDELWRFVFYGVSLRQDQEPLCAANSTELLIIQTEVSSDTDLNSICFPLIDGDVSSDDSSISDGSVERYLLGIEDLRDIFIPKGLYQDIFPDKALPERIYRRSLVFIHQYLKWIAGSELIDMSSWTEANRTFIRKLALESALFLYGLNPPDTRGDFSVLLLLRENDKGTFTFYTTRPGRQVPKGFPIKVTIENCSGDGGGQFSVLRRLRIALSGGYSTYSLIEKAKISDLLRPNSKWMLDLEKLAKDLNCERENLEWKHVPAKLYFPGCDELRRAVEEKVLLGKEPDYRNTIRRELVTVLGGEGPLALLERTSISRSVFFRLLTFYVRIQLNQPIILAGDTGCGKTSLCELAFILLRACCPENSKYCKTDVDISGDVTHSDVDAWRSKTSNYLFFDEFNTSDVCGYVEHMILNSSKTVIGAVNIREKAGEISRALAKVGMPQKLMSQSSGTKLISGGKKNEAAYDMSQFKYFVHLLSDSCSSAIIDCNPWPDGTEPPLLPSEEKDNIANLIRCLAWQKGKVDIEILGKFEKCLLAAFDWIRKFTQERAVVCFRDVNTCFSVFWWAYNKKATIDNPVLFSIFICFGLRLPVTLTVNSPSSNLQKHIQSLQTSRLLDTENGKLKTRYSLLMAVCEAWNTSSETKVTPEDILESFCEFFREEHKDLLQDTNIWQFTPLFYHIFLMELCIEKTWACFIVGLPGTSKTFAYECLKKIHTKCFCSTYMCSRGASGEGMRAQCLDTAYTIFNSKGSSERLCAFDEIGLLNLNESKPAKFLHPAIDKGIEVAPGLYKKIPMIGMTNFAMDFANMSRGLVACTDIPTREELISVFTQVLGSTCAGNVSDFFEDLWHEQMPESLALRSIYHLIDIWRILSEKSWESVPLNFVCQVARELINSRRLLQQGLPQSLFMDAKALTENWLGNATPKPVYEKKWKDALDNVAICLERFNTESVSRKSLCIVTQGYIAAEFFEDVICWKALMNPELCDPLSLADFLLRLSNDNIKSFKGWYPDDKKSKNVMWFFAEDFKQSVSSICRNSVSQFVEFLNSDACDSVTPVIVGNNPVLDSLLDVLNVPVKSEGERRNVLMAVDGFSTELSVKDTLSVLIVEKEEVDTFDTDFPLPLLDRLEMVPLDWEDIKYLSITKRFLSLATREGEYQQKTFDDVVDAAQDLEDFFKTIRARTHNEEDRIFHSSINDLRDLRDALKQGQRCGYFQEKKYVGDLMRQEWMNGMRCVIVTRSDVSDEISVGRKGQQVIYIDDFALSSSSELSRRLSEVSQGCAIVFRCIQYTKLHDQHIKSILSTCQMEKGDIDAFIIYYQCSQSMDRMTSTIKWPIFWIDDISNSSEGARHEPEIQRIVDCLKEGSAGESDKLLRRVFEGMFGMFKIPTKESTQIEETFWKWFTEESKREWLAKCFPKDKNFTLNPDDPFLSSHAQLMKYIVDSLRPKLLFLNIFAAEYMRTMAQDTGSETAKLFSVMNILSELGDLDDNDMLWTDLSKGIESEIELQAPIVAGQYLARLRANYPFIVDSDKYLPIRFLAKMPEVKTVYLDKLDPEKLWKIPGFCLWDIKEDDSFWNKWIWKMVDQAEQQPIDFWMKPITSYTPKEKLFHMCNCDLGVLNENLGSVDDTVSQRYLGSVFGCALLNISEETTENWREALLEWINDAENGVCAEIRSKCQTFNIDVNATETREVDVSEIEFPPALKELAAKTHTVASIPLTKSVFEMITIAFSDNSRYSDENCKEFIDWFCQGVLNDVDMPLISLQLLRCIDTQGKPEFDREFIALSALLEPWRLVEEPTNAAKALLGSLQGVGSDFNTVFVHFPGAQSLYRFFGKRKVSLTVGPTFSRCIWSYFALNRKSMFPTMGKFLSKAAEFRQFGKYVKLMEFLRKLSLKFQRRLPALFILLNCTTLVNVDGGIWPLLGEMTCAKPLLNEIFGRDSCPFTCAELNNQRTSYDQLNYVKGLIIQSQSEFVGILCPGEEHAIERHPFRHFWPDIAISNFSLESCLLQMASFGCVDISLSGTPFVKLVDEAAIEASDGEKDIFGLTREDWHRGLSETVSFSFTNAFTRDSICLLTDPEMEERPIWFLRALLAIYDSRDGPEKRDVYFENMGMDIAYNSRKIWECDAIERDPIYSLLPEKVVNWMTGNC